MPRYYEYDPVQDEGTDCESAIVDLCWCCWPRSRNSDQAEHPPYDDTEYECHNCGEQLTCDDDSVD